MSGYPYGNTNPPNVYPPAGLYQGAQSGSPYATPSYPGGAPPGPSYYQDKTGMNPPQYPPAPYSGGPPHGKVPYQGHAATHGSIYPPGQYPGGAHHQNASYPGNYPQAGYSSSISAQPPGMVPPGSGTHQGHGTPASQYSSGGSSMGKPQGSVSLRRTLLPPVNFNPDTDAHELYSAFRGIGCNKNKVFNIAGRRSSQQRSMICLSYNKLYKKDLMDRIKSEFRGNLETAVMGLFFVGPDSDAYFLRKSMKGLGTNDHTLCEIICSRSFEQLQAIKNSYQRMFKKSLESDISSDTSGGYRDALICMVNNPRQRFGTGDQNAASNDAFLLINKHKFSVFADEQTLIDVFCKKDYHQLSLTFTSYQSISGKSIMDLIKKCFSKDMKRLMKYIFLFILDPSAFVTANLKQGLKKIRPDSLTSTIVTRCEIDLGSGIDVYSQKYGSFKEAYTKQLGFADSDLAKLFDILCGFS